jgi:ParB family chromosome partitioning protein
MSKPRGGLGKGLSALIRPPEIPTPPPASPAPEAAQVAAPTGGAIPMIEIAKIRPNPFQPRADFDQVALDELKESIRQKGVIQAVTVRRVEDGMYELISGERRIRASSELGLETIPAYILDVRTNEEMLELALIENLQREHLNPIEIAISYQRLMADVGLSPEDVAQKVSKDRTTVVNFLRLLKLPTQIQDSLRKGQLTMGHARALVALPETAVQLRFYEQIIKKDLNVRQVERLVREYGKKSERKPAPAARPVTDDTVASIATRLQQVLATRVRVNQREEGKGEIVIEYYSPDDLGRLFDLIASIEH